MMMARYAFVDYKVENALVRGCKFPNKCYDWDVVPKWVFRSVGGSDVKTLIYNFN